MIIEFQPNRILLSSPEQWLIYYKQDNDIYFNEMYLTYDKLKLFLEQYGYETNDIYLLKEFGISVKNIKQNSKL
jgi:hypothetical protein